MTYIRPAVNYIPDLFYGRPLPDAQVYLLDSAATVPHSASDINPADILTVNYINEAGNTVEAPQPLRTTKGGCLYSGCKSQIKQFEVVPQEFIYAVYDKNGSLEWQGKVNGSDFVDANALAATDSTVLVGGVEAGKVSKRLDYVTPEEYGLVEGTDSGNSAKLQSILESGKKIKWGNKSYGFTSPVQITTPIEIDWESSGCRLYADFASHQDYLLRIAVLPKQHKSTGKLIFDCNSVCNEGLRLYNQLAPVYPDNYAALQMDNVEAKNAKRVIDSNGDASGITVRGCFSSIIFNNPKISNIRMASGSGVSGSVGAYGIGCYRESAMFGSGYPLYVEINNPDIDGVYCEDFTYTDDMDGILAFGGLASNDMFSYVQVNGGRLANCNGRSVKCQMTSGKVSGTMLFKDSGVTGGYGTNPDIDFQLGNGFVDGIICEYIGFVPEAIVSQQTSNFESAQFGYAKGIQYKVSGGVSLPAVVSTLNRQNQSGSVSIDGISGAGATDTIAYVGTPDDDMSVDVRNVSVDNVSQAIVTAYSGGGSSPVAPYVVRVSMGNIVNRGAAVAAIKSNIGGSSASCDLNVVGKLIGVTGTTRLINTSSNQPLVHKADGFAGNYQLGGYQRIYSVNVPAGGTIYLPQTGYTNNWYMLAAHFNAGRQAAALMSVDDGGVLSLAKGTLIEVGTTADPGVGSFRFWYSAADTAIAVRNTTGSDRILTVTQLG